MLTARQPDAELAGYCRRHGLVLVRISSTGTPPQAGADTDADWIDVRLSDDGRPAVPQALTALRSNPATTLIVRPDRVVAAVAPERTSNGAQRVALQGATFSRVAGYADAANRVWLAAPP